MKFPIEVLVIVGLSVVGQGCDHEPVFPENSTTTIRSVSEIDMWVVKPDASQDRVLRLPDRLGRVEIIMKDPLIPAIWHLSFHHGEPGRLVFQKKEGRLAVLLSDSPVFMESWSGNYLIVANDK